MCIYRGYLCSISVVDNIIYIKKVQISNFTLIAGGSVFCNYSCEMVSITTAKTLRDPDHGVLHMFEIKFIRSCIEKTATNCTANFPGPDS